VPEVYFTSHLRSIIGSGAHRVEAATVAAAMEAVFQQHPRARGYILDDQGCLRQHVAVFCEGQRIGPGQLDKEVEPHHRIDILQALSGG
jgi:sulfur-carrier protein